MHSTATNIVYFYALRNAAENMSLFKAMRKLDHLTLCLTFPSPCILHIINLVLHIIATLFQVIIALAAGAALFYPILYIGFILLFQVQ